MKIFDTPFWIPHIFAQMYVFLIVSLPLTHLHIPCLVERVYFFLTCLCLLTSLHSWILSLRFLLSFLSPYVASEPRVEPCSVRIC